MAAMITAERARRKPQDLGFLEIIAALAPILLPTVIDMVKGWFSDNPKAPTPAQLAAPINQGRYATKEAVQGYVSSALAQFPPNVRPGVAQMMWAEIRNQTPEIGLGFRAAARQYPDLEGLVKQGAFGPETFMEKYGKALIITGSIVGVAVLGVVVYKVVKRRRG